MKNRFFLILLFACCASFASEWELALDANAMFALNNYSENWAGGDVGGINWTANINGLAEKQLTQLVNTKNTLKLSFGQTHVQSATTGEWQAPTKATDLIDFETVFRFTLGTLVDPYASGRLESQFYDSRVVTNKRYFNPMRLSESAGIARLLMKAEKREWTARLGMGIRQSIDRDVLITVVDPFHNETQTTNDGGVEFVTELRTPLAQERIAYNTRFLIFTALFNSESEDLEGLPNGDYWKAPDINWEHAFTANITEYLMVNLYFQLLYDKEIDLKGRHKETLSLGLTYKFM
ncbi:DUF3078 domain-containing protein [bacterium]|nr:DUF3078 domain-containing protein [bacterium]